MTGKKDLSTTIFLLAGIIVVSFLVLGNLTGMMSVYATSNNEETITDDSINSDDWLYVYDGLSLWDKFKLGYGTQALTVVGGATCSTYPDLSQTYTASALNKCYTNNIHLGAVFQMFRVTSESPYTTTFMGSIDVLQGDKQCFSTIVGQRYHYDVYFCDNPLETNTCDDTDAGVDYFNKGTVSFSTNAYNMQDFDDYCSSTTKLNERYCDIDDSVQTQIYTCADKCEDGECVVVTPTTKTITCYPLMANCVAKTFTVGLTDDCSDVDYNNYDVASYSSYSDCDDIRNPDVPTPDPTYNCGEWVFMGCIGNDATETCMDSTSSIYGTSRTVVSDSCSGDVLTEECTDWRFIGCAGTMGKEQCFDTGSKLYEDTRTVDNADCSDDEPISTVECNDWEKIGCEDEQAIEYCHDSLSEKYKDTRLVDDSDCKNGETPNPNTFNLLDWIENNLMMVSGAMIGLILLLTILIVGVIFVSKKK